jgi:hypothetical protein
VVTLKRITLAPQHRLHRLRTAKPASDRAEFDALIETRGWGEQVCPRLQQTENVPI